MDLVNCTVTLAGDNGIIVGKDAISVAEVAVLQAIHGREAIADVRKVGVLANFNPRAHFEKLAAKYNREGEEGFSIATLFPGVTPQFPTKLSDIVLAEPAPVEPQPDEDGQVVLGGELVGLTPVPAAVVLDDVADDDGDDDEPPPAVDPLG